MNKKVNEIAKKIQDLIAYEVSDIKNEETKWETHYKNMMSELESELAHTNEMVSDFTESKLTLNIVEQEGYKRCLITMLNRFKDLETYM